jgi:hypothetical protein
MDSYAIPILGAVILALMFTARFIDVRRDYRRKKRELEYKRDLERMKKQDKENKAPH